MSAPSIAAPLPANPFPGPIPFKESDPIFGRGREIGELVDRLVADRLVLLYSPSGAGKSSMLNADSGVLSQMRERGFRIRKTVRVGLEPLEKVANRYVWSCATSLGAAYDPAQWLTDILGAPERDLLVFDQFEEILTASRADDAGRLEFFKQLGEAMRVKGRWAVFAIREDYLAPIDSYLEWLPTQLASRMRINVLGREAAGKAITLPVLATKTVKFEEGAVEMLLDDLSSGGWVEPVQLQVVCKDLWAEMTKQKLTVITKELVKNAGNAELALEKYYNTVVREVAGEKAARDRKVTERAIRDWFEDSLISAAGTRLQVIKGDPPDGMTGALPTTVVNDLERAHVVRSDYRSVAWCELTHDRMIRPVVESNRAWRADPQNLSVLQREAASWVKDGRPPDRVLRGKVLRAASKWAKQHAGELTGAEKELVARSRKARRKRWLVVCGVAAAFLFLTDSYFEAVDANQRSGNAEFRARTAAAFHCAGDDPACAADAALDADDLYRARNGFFDRNWPRWNEWLNGEAAPDRERSLRLAMIAATAQHDPRYFRLLDAGVAVTKGPCVWFAPDGTLWSNGRQGLMAFDPGRFAKSLQPAAKNACPGDFHLISRFDAPAGWTLFKQDNAVELHDPSGRGYRGAPADHAFAVTVDPTGRRAAWVTGVDVYVYLMDLQTSRVTQMPAGDLYPLAIRFSPDGNLLASGGQDHLLRLWRLPPSVDNWHKPVADIPLRGHSDSVVDVAFSPDGRQLASRAANRELIVWRVLPEFAPEATWRTEPVAFVPGVRVVTGAWDGLTIAELNSAGAAQQSRHVDVGNVKLIGMRRDGRVAVVVSKDGERQNVLRIVDLENARAGSAAPVDQAIVSAAISDDGKTVATIQGENPPVIALWSVEGDQLRRQPTPGWLSGPESQSGAEYESRLLTFLPGGLIGVAMSDHAFDVLGAQQRPRSIELRNVPMTTAISPDGHLLATLDNLHNLAFYGTDEAPGGSVKMPGSPRAIAFGADGKSFHVLLGGGRTYSWNIDLPYMRAEACRLVPGCEARGK